MDWMEKKRVIDCTLAVSPDGLVGQGFLGRQDIELPISCGEEKVNYPAAARLKRRWLRKAFEPFEKDRHGGRQSELDAFAGPNEFSRNSERKLAMAPERWGADPEARGKAAKPDHKV
jgi:hypothetical protein